ncbi:hypothetical protein RF55_1296 [Lasius niger]|uniref:Uncharacterized protein n=1 Tax=Lasius niger TaxID=67767 RepID=A0A0J7L5R8_LASNI|nr:hypothetical protein RF55_1296 [Lasius niger]
MAKYYRKGQNQSVITGLDQYRRTTQDQFVLTDLEKHRRANQDQPVVRLLALDCDPGLHAIGCGDRSTSSAAFSQIFDLISIVDENLAYSEWSFKLRMQLLTAACGWVARNLYQY